MERRRCQRLAAAKSGHFSAAVITDEELTITDVGEVPDRG
jgi:hypothetical protein